MHSRIFQVSMEPIDKNEYITESDYYDHWFTNSVANYVSDDCDAYDDVKWLQDCVKGITFGGDENGVYLIIKDKEKYFEDAFRQFKATLDVLKGCTIQDFTKGILDMYGLKNAYEEKFGFYVETEDNGLITMDNFIRIYPENEKFYIGGTINYHR